MTVAPKGVFTHFRYTLGAIGLALCDWAVLCMPEDVVRERSSPWRQVGTADPTGWKSLHRWARRCSELFGISVALIGATDRETAQRAAYRLIARGPPGDPLDGVFFGAAG